MSLRSIIADAVDEHAPEPPSFRQLLDEKLAEAGEKMKENPDMALFSGISTPTNGTNWATQSTNESSSTLKLNDINRLTEEYYAKPMEQNLLYGSTPLIVSPHTYTAFTGPSDYSRGRITKEKKMEDTTNIVARARADRRKEQAEALIPDIEERILSHKANEGTIVRAAVEFPDNDTRYQYVWVKGGGKSGWFKTYSTRKYTFEQMVDELVRLTIDSVVCEIEVLDGPSDDGSVTPQDAWEA